MVDVNALADRLIEAIEKRTATEPFATDLGLSFDQAYDVQDAVLARLGEPVRAAKLGLTSVAKQRQMNVSEPLYGWLTESMDLAFGDQPAGSGGSASFDRSRFIQPRAEPEVAFLTNADLAGQSVSVTEVLAATEAILPAIDILDSRFTGYQFTLADVTADNSSAGGYVTGSPSSLGDNLDLTGCVFEKNGEIVATAAGASVMGHPAEAVAWFVRKLHERGRHLPAGSLVLAGAWTAAVPMEPGDTARATFDRYGSVEVTCR